MKNSKKKLKKRIELLEQVFSQKFVQVNMRHLEHTEQVEVVAMFHIENRLVMDEKEFYKYHTEMNTTTGKVHWEYFCDDLKYGIHAKMSQLLCDGRLKNEIKVYVNHPMRVRKD